MGSELPCTRCCRFTHPFPDLAKSRPKLYPDALDLLEIYDLGNLKGQRYDSAIFFEVPEASPRPGLKHT